jgi:sensor histidine kinase YesM
MLPYVIGANLIVFGSCILDSALAFLTSFGFSVIYMFAGYYVFGSVAVMIKHRFPLNSDLFRRIGLMLPVFYMINILLITGFYTYYNLINILPCEPLPRRFWWAVLFGSLTSTVITFINEALANWESWKVSITETEQLRNTYHKTRLLGLRGQVNPHFLFNCFNSLSSLINENEEEAEKFLNEMTRVHRYMLGYNDEQMVTLDDELKFAQSYLYLTDARFGNAVQVSIEVLPEDGQKLLPPLSLQIILENIIYSNAISKDDPLKIEIKSDGASLSIKNSLHAKANQESVTHDEGLDNLVKKYKLLNKPAVVIKESAAEREIILPLFNEKNN